MSEIMHVLSEDGGEFVEVPDGTVASLLAQVEAAKDRRAEAMPTEQDAIRAMFDAWLRLKELGWREATYAPRDGTIIEVVEPGSTGVHAAHRDEQGRFWIGEWPSTPCLFRAPDREPTP